MHTRPDIRCRVMISGAALVTALLITRLIARLLAARPDNPAIALIYGLTEPLIWPLRWLDAQQPRFGAVLEWSTLAAILVCILLGWFAGRRLCRSGAAATVEPTRSSHAR